jgi:hypothetical protein
MSSWTEITVSGALAVVLFDAIAAFASRKMEVPYDWATSWAIGAGRVAKVTVANWLFTAISVAGIAAGVAALGAVAA